MLLNIKVSLPDPVFSALEKIADPATVRILVPFPRETTFENAAVSLNVSVSFPDPVVSVFPNVVAAVAEITLSPFLRSNAPFSVDSWLTRIVSV